MGTYKTNQSCTLQKLEETLAEYDSDEIGSLEQECEDIQGFRNINEDDQLVNTTLTEYLQQSKDDNFYIHTTNQQQNKKEEKGGYKALVGTKLIPAKQLQSPNTPEEKKKTLGELLKEADDILAQPYQEPP